MDSLFSKQWILLIFSIISAGFFFGGQWVVKRIRSKRNLKNARKDMRIKAENSGVNNSDPDNPDFKRQAIEALKAEIDRLEKETILEVPPPAQPATQVTGRAEKWSKEGFINAEIIDPVRRTIGLYHLDLEENKDYGRQYLIGGNWIFSLRINPSTGQLDPAPHSVTMDHPPSEVYECIQTKEMVVEVFGDHDEEQNKLKIGLLVLAACVALFLMAMYVFKGSKGG